MDFHLRQTGGEAVNERTEVSDYSQGSRSKPSDKKAEKFMHRNIWREMFSLPNDPHFVPLS